ncbi:MAG TPA: pyridoxamine 5'-phosphate oxidase family protein [Levilinea sp.]|nr:pyridoxamine 5'-phosphate oxidase family protein [Levilinea sp.]
MTNRSTADRPQVPGYGIPETIEGVLPWSHVAERMEKAINYWIATVDSGCQPHATPVWGVWLDDTFYFDGSPQTRRGRNLAANPAVAVHLESGSDVVILRGHALEVIGIQPGLAERLAAAYTIKYGEMGYTPMPDTWNGGGLYRVTIQKAFAWSQFPSDATRWRFS